MNIQPNLMNRNYSQPAFQAKFANDDETKEILNRFMYGKGGPEAVYCLIQNLDNMNSQDEISIDEKPNGGTFGALYTISNKRTGASVNFYRTLVSGPEYLDYAFLKYSDDEHGDLGTYNNPAKGLYECMTKNLGSLFEDTSLKPGAEFIKPSAKTLRNIDGMTWDYQKQCELKKDIGIINYKIRGLEKERDEKAKEKHTVDNKIHSTKFDYVANQLDMRA